MRTNWFTIGAMNVQPLAFYDRNFPNPRILLPTLSFHSFGFHLFLSLSLLYSQYGYLFRNRRLSASLIFGRTLLKLKKFWIAVTRRWGVSVDRANENRNRGIFPFKMPFHSSRYDFGLPRYRGAKRKVIFDLSLASRLDRLYSKLETSDSRDSCEDVVWEF